MNREGGLLPPPHLTLPTTMVLPLCPSGTSTQFVIPLLRCWEGENSFQCMCVCVSVYVGGMERPRSIHRCLSIWVWAWVRPGERTKSSSLFYNTRETLSFSLQHSNSHCSSGDIEHMCTTPAGVICLPIPHQNHMPAAWKSHTHTPSKNVLSGSLSCAHNWTDFVYGCEGPLPSCSIPIICVIHITAFLLKKPDVTTLLHYTQTVKGTSISYSGRASCRELSYMYWYLWNICQVWSNQNLEPIGSEPIKSWRCVGSNQSCEDVWVHDSMRC